MDPNARGGDDNMIVMRVPRDHAGALVDHLRTGLHGISDQNLRGFLETDLLRPLEQGARQDATGGTRSSTR